MTHDQRNTIHSCLMKLGRIDAQAIADTVRLPIEATYEALVSLESAGLARVELTYSRRNVLAREWVAA